MTGVVDFDEIGLRRSIQLKILDLSESGMTEIGTWTDVHRLSITQYGVQQISAIRKHLQVVTREVKLKKKRADENCDYDLGKTVCCQKDSFKWFGLLRRILFVCLLFCFEKRSIDF